MRLLSHLVDMMSRHIGKLEISSSLFLVHSFLFPSPQIRPAPTFLSSTILFSLSLSLSIHLFLSLYSLSQVYALSQLDQTLGAAKQIAARLAATDPAAMTAAEIEALEATLPMPPTKSNQVRGARSAQIGCRWSLC
jgi:hypothetical protein